MCVCVCALAPIHAHLALLHSLSNRRVGRRGRHAAAHAHGMALQPLSDRARGARLQTPASVPVLTPNARASAAVRLEKDICGMFHGAGGAPRQAWVMVSEGVWCLKVYDIISGPDRWQGSGFSPAAGGENFWAFFSPCICTYIEGLRPLNTTARLQSIRRKSVVKHSFSTILRRSLLPQAGPGWYHCSEICRYRRDYRDVGRNLRQNICAVAWAPDGSKIASGSNDHTVHVQQWHCISGECEMILAGDKPVWSVASSCFPPPPPNMGVT